MVDEPLFTVYNHNYDSKHSTEEVYTELIDPIELIDTVHIDGEYSNAFQGNVRCEWMK